jgi:hypothetical protein
VTERSNRLALQQAAEVLAEFNLNHDELDLSGAYD